MPSFNPTSPIRINHCFLNTFKPDSGAKAVSVAESQIQKIFPKPSDTELFVKPDFLPKANAGRFHPNALLYLQGKAQMSDSHIGEATATSGALINPNNRLVPDTETIKYLFADPADKTISKNTLPDSDLDKPSPLLKQTFSRLLSRSEEIELSKSFHTGFADLMRVIEVLAQETNKTVYTDALKYIKQRKRLGRYIAYDNIVITKALCEINTIDTSHKTDLIYEGEYAYRQLIVSNYRLVCSTARNFTGSALDFEDIVQEGCIGLIMSISRFDPNRGIKFSSYATYWIKASIDRCIKKKSRTIAVPIGKQEELSMVLQYYYELLKYGEVSRIELAEYSGIPLERIESMLMETQSILSLNAPLLDDPNENMTLQNLIKDKNSKNPELETLITMAQVEILKIVNSLCDREKIVITMRYGLNGESEHSLREIGERIGVSRERVRQIVSQLNRHIKNKFEEKGMFFDLLIPRE